MPTARYSTYIRLLGCLGIDGANGAAWLSRRPAPGAPGWLVACTPLLAMAVSVIQITGHLNGAQILPRHMKPAASTLFVAHLGDRCQIFDKEY